MQATSHILKRRCDLTKQNVIIRKFRTGGGEHEHERTAKANEHSRRHHTNRAGTRFRNTKLQAGPATNWYFKLIRISELTEVFAEPVRVQAFMNHTGECIAIKKTKWNQGQTNCVRFQIMQDSKPLTSETFVATVSFQPRTSLLPNVSNWFETFALNRNPPFPVTTCCTLRPCQTGND